VEAAGAGGAMVERFASRELEHELDAAFGETVIVSCDEDTVFLYAGSREQADRAGALVARLADEHGWRLASELRRWHPDAEEWRDPDEPLPADPESRRAEHATAIADERAEVAERG